MVKFSNKTGYSLSVSELVQETYSYGYTDPVLFNSLITKLTRFYEQTQNHKKINRRIKESYAVPRGTKRVSSDLRFKSGFSRPRIDKELEREIRKYGAHTLPSTIKMPEYRQVYKSDVDCLQRYSKINKNIKRSHLRQVVIAGVNAARHMDLIGRRGDSLCQPLNTIKSVESISKNTNSGYPFYKKKNDPTVIKDTKRWLDGILNECTSFRLFKNSLMMNPEVIFNRFQPTLSDNLKTLDFKIRQVWCVPFRIVALENLFFNGLLERHKSRQFSFDKPVVTAGLNNKSISVKCVKRLRNCLGSRNRGSRQMYSLDYSKFDSTIPDFAIDLFFSICRRQINLSPKQSKVYELLRFYTKRSPYIYSDGYGFQQRGISSGSLITSTFDSWWNLTLWYLARAASHQLGDNFDSVGEKGADVLDHLSRPNVRGSHYIPFWDIVVCGDDVLCVTEPSVVQCHKLICEYLGMKCEVFMRTEDIEHNIFFLGRYWDKFNRPYQSEEYITSHIISRTKWYKKDETDFDISKYLDVYRILSICCPLHNGKRYINRYLKDYKPLNDFLLDKNEFGYLLLKDWHSESNSFINKDNMSNWSLY